MLDVSCKTQHCFNTLTAQRPGQRSNEATDIQFKYTVLRLTRGHSSWIMHQGILQNRWLLSTCRHYKSQQFLLSFGLVISYMCSRGCCFHDLHKQHHTIKPSQALLVNELSVWYVDHRNSKHAHILEFQISIYFIRKLHSCGWSLFPSVKMETSCSCISQTIPYYQHKADSKKSN